MNQRTLPAAFPLTPRMAAFRHATIVLLGTLFVAVCAHVSFPLSFTPVPLTLQPFAVLVLGMMLGPRMAAGTLGVYLAEGAVGLPVFAPGAAGVSGIFHLLGPTGGYLLAYPVGAFAISSLWRVSNRSMTWALVSTAVGNGIILGIGAVWLTLYSHGSFSTVLSQAVLPFLPGDALKVVAASFAGYQWQRMRSRRTDSTR